MTEEGVELLTWQSELERLATTKIDRILIAQCSLDWLRPEYRHARDVMDELLINLCMQNPSMRVDRIVLLNLPTFTKRQIGDLDELALEHSHWIRCLDITLMLLDRPNSIRVHRLMTRGDQDSVGFLDFFDVQRRGIWLRPEATESALTLLRSGRRITPMTGSDIHLEGPFGDKDPSVYL